jgi:hypothetical protein
MDGGNAKGRKKHTGTLRSRSQPECFLCYRLFDEKVEN